MQTIGFAGSAKNTGKTTTALQVLDLARRAGYHVALTSIGYDGENRDLVTGLPKPRYLCQPGMIVATADSCLHASSAEFSHLRPTGIRTLLGEILIATVHKTGGLVLAGPNRGTDLLRLIEQLREMDVEVVLVDGALNRLAALTSADGLVLSSGAAFDERIERIASHAAAIEALFHLPHIPCEHADKVRQVTCLHSSGRQFQLPFSSIMDVTRMQTVSTWLASRGAATLIVPGVFEPMMFARLVSELDQYLPGKQFVFQSPLHLLASGLPEVWQSAFQKAIRSGANVGCLQPGKLFFLTVNPFFPRYVQQSGGYVPAWIDKQDLLKTVREAVASTPVVDILQPPLPDLLALCGLSGK